jgi:hypothetical protein
MRQSVRVLLPVDADLAAIVADIIRENRTQPEWAAVESDDMFQRGLYVGGYEEPQRAFTFSFYGKDGELWFQFTLDEARAIAAGRQKAVCARPAEI